MLNQQDHIWSFLQVKDLGTKPLSSETNATLHLNDDQLRALLNVTAAIAEKSRAVVAIARPLTLEARVHFAGTGRVPAELETERIALEAQWTAAIMAGMRQLQQELPDSVFRYLDEFVRSGKPLFQTPNFPRQPLGSPRSDR